MSKGVPIQGELAVPRADEAAEGRRSAGDHAALYIRRLIFDGALLPGSRVPQDQIAQALGFSRIPVREALIGLEREGWVRVELHRGAFVNAFDEATVRDHYDLFGLVYGLAAERAMERTDIAELAATLRGLANDATRAKQVRSFADAALTFHRTVLEAAGSRPVTTVMQALSRLVPGDFFSLVPAAVEIERKGLPRIVAAIAAGDGERAAAQYRRVLRAVGGEVVDVFLAKGLLHDAATVAPAAARRPQRVSRTGTG